MTLVAVCPRCSTPLIDSDIDGGVLLLCPRCDGESEPFVYGHFDAARTAPRRERKPNFLRLVVGVVGGGVLGIFIGAYALLWLRGAEGDILGISRWLPESVLPPSIHAADRN